MSSLKGLLFLLALKNQNWSSCFILDLPKPKLKQKKTKTLRRMFWFEVKKCFLGFSLFFCCLGSSKTQKNLGCVLFFELTLSSGRKKKKHVLVFFKIQDTKKTKTNLGLVYFF